MIDIYHCMSLPWFADDQIYFFGAVFYLKISQGKQDR